MKIKNYNSYILFGIDVFFRAGIQDHGPEYQE